MSNVHHQSNKISKPVWLQLLFSWNRAGQTWMLKSVKQENVYFLDIDTGYPKLKSRNS